MRTFTLALLASLVAVPRTPQEVIFVADGQARAVREIGGAWARADGFLRGHGTGNLLRASYGGGAGGVTIRARVALEVCDGTAASPVLGGQSHFGFDGRDQQVFVEGPLLGGGPSALGAASPYVRDGEPFEVKVARHGDELSLIIGDEIVLCTRAPASEPLGSIALRRVRYASVPDPREPNQDKTRSC